MVFQQHWAQVGNPDALVVDIMEMLILMNIQEMSTAIQYRLPLNIYFNNEYMGMVRQWQTITWRQIF